MPRKARFSDEEDLGMMKYGHETEYVQGIITSSTGFDQQWDQFGVIKPYSEQSTYSSAGLASSGSSMNRTLNLDMS